MNIDLVMKKIRDRGGRPPAAIARFSLLLTVSLFSLPVSAGLNIFTCEPEWAALAEELTGGQAKIYSATTGTQDPHHIQARPSLIAKVRQADLLVCTGAELEVGWLPVLLRKGSNPRVQPGKPGYFQASDYVVLKEKPAIVDRSLGDVHAAGNPHIQTDPRNIQLVANALAQRLANIDPARADLYQSEHQAFTARWQQATLKWIKHAEVLRGTTVVSEHKNWGYLYDWLGMSEVATLEALAGVPPSAAHLSSVLLGLEQNPAQLIVRAAYQNDRPSRWLASRSGLPVAELPFTVGGLAATDDLFALFDVTIERLLQAAGG